MVTQEPHRSRFVVAAAGIIDAVRFAHRHPDVYDYGRLPIHRVFREEVLRKRPYLKKAWCIRVIQNPAKAEPQENNRFRF